MNYLLNELIKELMFNGKGKNGWKIKRCSLDILAKTKQKQTKKTLKSVNKKEHKMFDSVNCTVVHACMKMAHIHGENQVR